ncbi:hypothetical protein A9W97_17860 [Mycobacterium gordonae]|nr:hypothetical protein A9W97_17860 [Mycobacterium gordonae]
MAGTTDGSNFIHDGDAQKFVDTGRRAHCQNRIFGASGITSLTEFIPQLEVRLHGRLAPLPTLAASSCKVVQV